MSERLKSIIRGAERFGTINKSDMPFVVEELKKVVPNESEPEVLAIGKLYKHLMEQTTIFGAEFHGTPVHRQLELALNECRKRWAELNPKKSHDKIES